MLRLIQHTREYTPGESAQLATGKTLKYFDVNYKPVFYELNRGKLKKLTYAQAEKLLEAHDAEQFNHDDYAFLQRADIQGL